MSVPNVSILQGNALEVLRTLPDESVHCCVTSPPYWGLRDYGVPGQLGLEKTPEEYVAKMVAVFREVRRVLRGDGTLWLNMGDSYVANGGPGERGMIERGNPSPNALSKAEHLCDRKPSNLCGLPAKNLLGIPWRLAFALQADGWWLRSDIIWHKPNPMPESVTDRPTKAHEYVFLLSKSGRYFFDAEAVKTPASESYANDSRWETGGTEVNYKTGYAEAMAQNPKMPHKVFNGERQTSVNRRSVWTINSEPYPEAHFATFPTALVKPCILAGTSARGCCPKCGGPWERVVEQGPVADGYTPGKTPAFQVRRFASATSGFCRETTTTGWRPTCDCYPPPDKAPDCFEPLAIPCTVLDPFGGSGTTGLVALENGRSAILIELNPKYIELARNRCHVTPSLSLA